MGPKQATAVLQDIRKRVDTRGALPASDRALLKYFAEQRDEHAFRALVDRHGAMVMGVAFRVLRQHQDAEDVCQATFLLLACKANATAWRESVANWLYEVAYRLSLKARDRARRRSDRERKAQSRTPGDVLAEISARDLQAILDEEMSRLAKKYRTPLVLCCLEGKTRDEAARFLDVPLSTVISRLDRARELLRRRFARRGVPLSLALAGATLTTEAVRAAITETVRHGTCRLALRVLAGEAVATAVSANVALLVKGGLQAMFLSKLKASIAALLAVGALVTCALLAGVARWPATTRAEQAAQERKDPAQDKDKQPATGIPAERVVALAWSNNGKLVTIEQPAESAKPGAPTDAPFTPIIKVREAATGKELFTVATPPKGFRFHAGFSPDARTLVVACRRADEDGHIIEFFDVEKGERLGDRGTVTTDDSCPPAFAFAPEGKSIAMLWARTGEGAGVQIWDAESRRIKTRIPGHNPLAASLAWSSNGERLAVGGDAEDKTLHVWKDVDTGGAIKPVWRAKLDGVVRSLAFSADDKTLAGVVGEGDLVLWDAESGEPRKTLDIGKAKARLVIFSKDGNWLAASGEDKGKQVVWLWNAKDDALVQTWTDIGHRSIAFANEDRAIAALGRDGKMRLLRAK